jgi:hypothetical protein
MMVAFSIFITCARLGRIRPDVVIAVIAVIPVITILRILGTFRIVFWKIWYNAIELHQTF